MKNSPVTDKTEKNNSSEAEERECRRIEEQKRQAAEQVRLRIAAEQKRRIAAQRRAEYKMLLARRDELLRIIEENKGLFREKARKRKEAKAELAKINLEMDKYPGFE